MNSLCNATLSPPPDNESVHTPAPSKDLAEPPLLSPKKKRSAVAALFTLDGQPPPLPHNDKEEDSSAEDATSTPSPKRMRPAAKHAIALMACEPRLGDDDDSSTCSDDTSFAAQDTTSTSDSSSDDSDSDSDDESSSEDEHTTRKWALKDLEDICVSSDEERPDTFIPESLILAVSKPQAKRRAPSSSALASAPALCIARTQADWARDLRAMASRARQSMQPELDRAVYLAEVFNVAVRRASLAQLAKPVRGEDAPFLEISFDMRQLDSNFSGQLCVTTLGAMGMYDNMLLKLALCISPAQEVHNTMQIAHIHLCDKQFDKQLGFALLDSSLHRELVSYGLTWIDFMLALFGLAIMSDESSQIDIKRKQRLRQSLTSEAHGAGALLRELIEKWSQAPCSKSKAVAAKSR